MNRSPEDLLRDALRDDEPVGAGSFDDVRARARKLAHRARLLKASAAIVVVLAAVGVSIPLLTGDDDNKQRVITQPSPQTTEKPDDEPRGIWPFATGAQADDDTFAQAVPGDPTDAVQMAKGFLAGVVGLTPTELSSHTDGKEMLVVARTESSRTTTVELARLGTSGRWTVVGVSADGLVLDSLDVNGSSVRVSGRATAFEGTVDVRVVDRQREPKKLGEGVLTGEMGELKPFTGDVAFEPDGSGLGAVIAVTRSAKDGSVEQVAAAPIRWTVQNAADDAYDLRGAIWPFTSGAEADDKAIDPGFNTTDPIEVAKQFLLVFASMKADSLHALENSGYEANIAADVGPNRTVLALRRLGSSDRWTVVAAKAEGLELSRPGAGQLVSSPLRVEGRATAFEGTVLVKVTDRAKSPNELGHAVLTGEMGLLKPFAGDVAFQPGEMDVGALIAYTESAKDGSVEQLAAAPIRWGPEAP